MINHESNNPSEKTRLVSGEAQSYSISNEWVLDDDGNLPSYRTLTTLELGSDEDGSLGVIQLRSEDDSMRIMIVDPRSKPTQTDLTGSQVLRADVPAVIGRAHERFAYLPNTVSREHVSVLLKRDKDGAPYLAIADLDTPNHTYITPNSVALEKMDDIEREPVVNIDKPLGSSAVTGSREVSPEDQYFERKATDREAKLFAPYVRPVVPEMPNNVGMLQGGKYGDKNPYAYLSEPDDEIAMQNMIDLELLDIQWTEAHASEIKSQQEYDKFVTEGSMQDAIIQLQSLLDHDDTLNRLIADIRGVDLNKQPVREIVPEVRENERLRLSIGMYLTVKLDALMKESPGFGERVIKNDQKSPGGRNFVPVDNLTSKEYVVLLALSMVDGSFNKQTVGTDDLPGMITGQHRHAAQKLLA